MTPFSKWYSEERTSQPEFSRCFWHLTLDHVHSDANREPELCATLSGNTLSPLVFSSTHKSGTVVLLLRCCGN